MSPPTPTATAVLGGSTAPTKDELIDAARTVLDHFHVPFGVRRTFRLVESFKVRSPHGGRHLFFQYLCSAVEIDAERQRSALLDPDVAKAVSYNDPTGEHAVRNVMRERGR